MRRQRGGQLLPELPVGTAEKAQGRDLAGGQVVKALSSHCRGQGSTGWSGNYDPMYHEGWPKKKKKREKMVQGYCQGCPSDLKKRRLGFFCPPSVPPSTASRDLGTLPGGAGN